jgi:hypothetical protein
MVNPTGLLSTAAVYSARMETSLLLGEVGGKEKRIFLWLTNIKATNKAT